MNLPKLSSGLKIVGGIIAAAGALAGILTQFHKKVPDIEILDATAEGVAGRTQLVVKLRNRGDAPALVKDCEIDFSELTATAESADYAADVTPAHYDWLITSADLIKRRTVRRVARKLEPGDADVMEFALGWERVKSTLKGHGRLTLHYDVSGKTRTKSEFPIEIANSAGAIPVVRSSTDPAENLTRLAEDEPSLTQAQLINSLTNSAYRPAAATVTGFLARSDPNVRRSAASYFGKIQAPGAINALMAALHDSDVSVRTAAYAALKFQGDESVPALIQATRSANSNDREAAVSLLGEIGSLSAEPALVAALGDRTIVRRIGEEDQLLAAAAVRSLWRMRAASLEQAIDGLVADPADSVAREAIEAAHAGRMKRAIPALIGRLSPSDSLRENAHAALVALHGRDFGWNPRAWTAASREQLRPR